MAEHQDHIEEFWVGIDLLPNYEVSNYGRVINVNTGRELKPCPNDKGYLKVELYHKGVKHPAYVHRLVAKAFFVDYEEGVEVRHLNGNRSDNGVLNITIGPSKVRKSES